MYVSVSYDVTSDKTRRYIVKVLESYGFRVQRSVFEIECTMSQYKRLKNSLQKVLEKAKKNYPDDHDNIDSVKFYILSKVGEGNLDGRIDGVGEGYEKVYFEDCLIL